jgi:hypothetical protein
MRHFVLISVLTVVVNGCAGGSTAPSLVISATSPSAVASKPGPGNLTIVSGGLVAGMQVASGDWPYQVTLRLRETGGLVVDVENIQVQVSLGSDTVGTETDTAGLSVGANSTRDVAFMFAAHTHVDRSVATMNVTLQFKDAEGNVGSVTEAFSGFGYWDY